MDHTEIRPKLVTIQGALHQIPVKRTKLYGLIDDGTLTRVKVGARTFILQESIDGFVARLAADAPRPREDSLQESIDGFVARLAADAPRPREDSLQESIDGFVARLAADAPRPREDSEEASEAEQQAAAR